jgi:hypothetical protein
LPKKAGEILAPDPGQMSGCVLALVFWHHTMATWIRNPVIDPGGRRQEECHTRFVPPPPSATGSNGELNATTKDITNNSWQEGLSATSADFASVDTALLKSKRKSDGGPTNVDYVKLVPASDLRNAGVDVGLPFNGSAPDLGLFESAE